MRTNHHFPHNAVKMYPLDSLSSLSTQCEYKVTKKGQNLRSKHEGVKYPCVQCDYKAIHKTNLFSHIKKKHKGVKYI